MNQQGLLIRPVTPVIGAEMLNVDLDVLDESTLEEIHGALMSHCVLFFRDQDISIQSQKALGAWLSLIHI